MSADPSVSPVGSPSTVADGVDVFELGAEHEQVVFCNDHATGLRAIVAIHSTALGPGLGGTRFYPYATTADAIRDVLNLSRGMSYKAALAGLDLGGGKAVIIGDPTKDKTEALLRAYGRFVQAIGGRYYTACDVGTYSEDMDVVARECSFVTGRTVAHGGAGDSSVLTAYGVYQGMRASAEALWGAPTLSGRTVGIAGVGKVGHHLVKHLVEDGAQVVVTDVYQPAVERVVQQYGATAVADADALVRADIDVYAPCAMGDALTDEVVDVLTAKIVCGAANNQLSHPGHREGAGRPRDPLRARLLRELRRPDPGGRRARGLQLRAGRAARVEDLRHDQGGLRAGPHRRGHPRRGRRPSRRAPDARRRPPARALPHPWLALRSLSWPSGRPAQPRGPMTARRANSTGQSRDGST